MHGKIIYPKLAQTCDTSDKANGIAVICESTHVSFVNNHRTVSFVGTNGTL